MKRKTISCFTALLMGFALVPASGYFSDMSVVKAADHKETGTVDGYDYELWNQNNTGSADMQLGSNGAFSCSWDGIENCLFRTGKKFSGIRKYQYYGDISINYDVDYQPMGNSYMCVYGWTENPDVEFYIVDAWGDWRPSGDSMSLGTVSSDGKEYDFYKSTRHSVPSIHGTYSYDQYMSVRKTNPAQVNEMNNLNGTITVTNHFRQWKNAGLSVGDMYKVSLNIEGYRSSGKAEVKKNDISLNASSSFSSDKYMEYVRGILTSNVPDDVKRFDNGETTKITYYSNKAQRNKSAYVWLPLNYSEDRKYPVLYMNHGLLSSEDELLTGWDIREMATGLIRLGEVEPFIIVFPQMYTGPDADRPSEINQQTCDYYDDFLYDLTESLMPYMSEHYSVAEGRENTAIAGFSIGGRESLYIGMKAADKIGYICASSPTPGIVPAQDMILNYRGSMAEDEFKFDSIQPYLLMIGGGTEDTVAGTFPKKYHELYDKNGTDNIWIEFEGAGHDLNVGTPLFYNFFRNLFKGSPDSEIQTPPVTTAPSVTTIPSVTTTPPVGTAPSVTTTPPVTTIPISNNVIGDVDCNGAVTAADLVNLMQAMTGKTTLSAQSQANADYNRDGNISILDVIMLKNLLIS